MNIDQSQSTFDILYILSGDPATPTIDSFLQDGFSTGLSDIPDSGTVYRFTPKKATSINHTAVTGLMKLYPTICKDEIFIESLNMTNMNYRLISLGGGLFGRGQVSPGKNIINVSNLPHGAYYIGFDHEGVVETHKFIKL